MYTLENKIVKITNFSEYIIVQLQGFNNYLVVLDTYNNYILYHRYSELLNEFNHS